MNDTTLRSTPYKGLTPYTEEDAPFFFGRKTERKIIAANLIASRLTLLYGPTGVGKTSLLNAGVAYDLRTLARHNLAQQGVPELVVVVFNSWSDDPLKGLIKCICGAVCDLFEEPLPEPDSLPSKLDEALEAGSSRVKGHLFVILDQFEEYFTYYGQQRSEGSFYHEFPRALRNTTLQASFLISIREDELAKLDNFKGSIPNIFDNYLRVKHLDHSAARVAIECPIEEYNRQNQKKIGIDPSLVDTVLDQVQTGEVDRGLAGTGASPMPTEAHIETPYLQLIMTRLWEEELGSGSDMLRLETLDKLGRAERIVRTHLDETMKNLGIYEQYLAARIFHYLVTPSGTKIAHTALDLAKYTNVPEEQIIPILEILSRGEFRILRPIEPPQGQLGMIRYEIFHDVLALPILDWRLRHREDQSRTFQEAVQSKVLATLLHLPRPPTPSHIATKDRTSPGAGQRFYYSSEYARICSRGKTFSKPRFI